MIDSYRGQFSNNFRSDETRSDMILTKITSDSMIDTKSAIFDTKTPLLENRRKGSSAAVLFSDPKSFEIDIKTPLLENRRKGKVDAALEGGSTPLSRELACICMLVQRVG